jgi:hypothetical protein
MANRRIIKASHLIADIRNRVSDFELMEKYQLSLDQLEEILEKLVERQALRPEELQERGAHYDDPANRILTRRTSRYYLKTPLIVKDLNDPFGIGIVTDLSEEGFRTRYFAADLDERRSLLLSVQNMPDIEPVTVTAVCRWTRLNAETEVVEAGFEIVHLAEDMGPKIRKIIMRLSMGDRNVMRPKSGLVVTDSGSFPF